MANKYIKIHLASLATKQMQIKTKLRFHLTPPPHQNGNHEETKQQRRPVRMQGWEWD
jgi:hypothetical protein